MSNYGIFDKNIDKIKNWLSNGWSCYKIAKELNCGKSSICKKVKEYNLINSNKPTRDNNNLLKDKLSKVIELFNDGHNMTQIGKMLGYNESSIFALLKKNNIDTSKYKCKYSLDESYFEKIDTPNKAYILGWFYSDGNVMPNGKCRIQIHHSDRAILEQIKNELKYTGELIDIPARNTSEPQVLLNVDRKKVADDLIKLGVVPNKSLVIAFPSFDVVPENLISHFVRGVFDGDGSISITKKGFLSVGITSTDVFCLSLSEYLKPLGITGGHFYYRRKDKNTGSFLFGTKDNTRQFLSWLYKDAELKLQRKHEKALLFI